MKPVQLAAFVVALTSTLPALGLEQKTHRSLSRDACDAAGLDANFCELVGTTAYNVDADEWSSPSAHAQAAEGQSRCDGANATAQRIALLSSEIRTQLDAPPSSLRTEALATAFGRSLHTLQDNCAHAGMPNTQHAWASLSDTCTDSKDSPDIQPEAIECAKQETERAVNVLVDTLSSAGVSTTGISDVELNSKFPARGSVCAFLDSAQTWDGVDHRWDRDKMVTALGNAFALGLAGLSAPSDLCNGDPQALDPANPAATVDTSGGQWRCGLVDLYCIGKGDAPDEAPPWVKPEPAASGNDASSGGGCALSTGPVQPNPWIFAGLLLFGLRRRRRAR